MGRAAPAASEHPTHEADGVDASNEPPRAVPAGDAAVHHRHSSESEARAARRPSVTGQGALAELGDAQLVGLARTGERAAFEALYRRHVAFALHLAARIEGSSRDVEDVVHDAFIKAYTRLGDLTEPGSFRGWLGSIVVFAVRSRLRRQRLLSMLGLGRGSEPVELDSLASSEASPHVRAQLAQIYALLRTQPTDDRIAWTLRYVEGHELEVVAGLVGCSLATVKRRISRSQKFLEEHFVSEGRDSQPSIEVEAQGARAPSNAGRDSNADHDTLESTPAPAPSKSAAALSRPARSDSR